MVGMDSKSWLMLYVSRFIGLPYKWGGSNPIEGFDCSGLIIEYLSAAGEWKHGQDTTAQGLYDRFYLNGCNTTDDPDFGDLVFFGKSEEKITHIGLAIGGGLMIEAGGGGRKCLTKVDAANSDAFVRIRPIRYRRDLVTALAI